MSKDNENEEIFRAMEIYLQEYIHRDSLMWKHNFTLFISTLIVIMLPYLTERIGIDIPQKFDNSQWIFSSLGIVMSFVFLIRAKNLAKRFQAVSLTYDNLIKQLPKRLRRISIDNGLSVRKKRFHVYVMPLIMFLALISLSVILLI